ncbi:methyltransferase domain-containing protein [Actinotignum urinale]|uniref:class I SAM-dependent methyltransferase n=1 Tax=Actinotignum urinale TaxID=190146 RepID=UPI00254392BF|nr:class I SAM-dependent methyltransferase [Actinotignum urinale]MDY5152125.1 methyltransferase domain-containing protein [Actinotignum urinale]WIK58965.1 methyltransferase domain-containing protein [Actinotignum urinale]
MDNIHETNQANETGARERGKRLGPEESRMQGHWLLAKIGKTVLRPGGLEMTHRILDNAHITDKDRVVEFGPGVGRTAKILFGKNPESYTGVDREPREEMRKLVAEHPKANLVSADAKDTGLPPENCDVIVGEAMLTMQPDAAKKAIMEEAFRILAPGGRYAIHEMGLDSSLTDEDITRVKKDLSTTIKVGARPLVAKEWVKLLESVGFEVPYRTHNEMALLKPRRVLADEGIFGVMRIMKNLLKNKAARNRVKKMRAVFKKHEKDLRAVGFVAVKPTA